MRICCSPHQISFRHEGAAKKKITNDCSGQTLVITAEGKEPLKQLQPSCFLSGAGEIHPTGLHQDGKFSSSQCSYHTNACVVRRRRRPSRRHKHVLLHQASVSSLCPQKLECLNLKVFLHPTQPLSFYPLKSSCSSDRIFLPSVSVFLTKQKGVS